MKISSFLKPVVFNWVLRQRLQRLQHVTSRTHDVSVGIALARVNCNARGLLIPLGIVGPWWQQAAVEMNEAPSTFCKNI